jgi:hypothetical protein
MLGLRDNGRCVYAASLLYRKPCVVEQLIHVEIDFLFGTRNESSCQLYDQLKFLQPQHMVHKRQEWTMNRDFCVSF